MSIYYIVAFVVMAVALASGTSDNEIDGLLISSQTGGAIYHSYHRNWVPCSRSVYFGANARAQGSFSYFLPFTGLSWLIGASMQEILSSIIFLFVKHPYDVGDKVQISKEFYTVQEINLLSTIFIDSNSAYVQAPNGILNTLVKNYLRSMAGRHSPVFFFPPSPQWIQNIRRSKEVNAWDYITFFHSKMIYIYF